MKHFTKLSIALALIVAAFSLNSCIIDYTPVTLKVYVTDEAGNDLLNAESEHFIGEGISMTYRGETYGIAPEAETKYYLPTFYGLELYSDDEGKYYLYFGELDGAENFNDSFVFTWPDGSTDKIHYKRKVLGMFINDKWKLNGKKTDNPITIVK